MKYKNPAVSVPYIGMDDEGTETREWAHFKFRGEVDRRRLKREVRKYLGKMLGRTVCTSEMNMLVHRRRVTELA